MAVLPIVIFGDPVLETKTKKIRKIDDRIRRLVDDMYETMKTEPGVGLAANQVGESIRLAIVDASAGKDPGQLMVLVNPEIKGQSGTQKDEEGCLSFPGIHGFIERPLNLTVEYQDLEGQKKTLDAEGFMARILAHEIDHLDGIVFIRRMSPLKRRMVQKSIRQMMKEGTWGMNAVFMGTPATAVPLLTALHSLLDVELVVTRPDRPMGRSGRPVPPPVGEEARRLGVPVIQPETIKGNETFEATLREIDPDVAVVVAYGRILPPSILSIPRMGCVNVHFSLLPEFRGAAPVQRAVLAGEAATGVSLMKLDEGLDTGPVIGQIETMIGEDESAGNFSAVSLVGAGLATAMLPDYLAGKVHPKPQNHDLATYAPIAAKGEGRIDFRTPGIQGSQHRSWHESLAAGPCSLRRSNHRHSRDEAFRRKGFERGVVRKIGKKVVVGCGDGLALELVRSKAREQK
ncbi:MAG: peptide deformylase [Rhodopseudomonas palustris]|nr:peptide deformylase [Rhodopseudomonas palustris]